MGAALGTNQRLFISAIGGTYRLGIQASNGATVGDLAVTPGWQHLCLNMNAGTDTATLYKDGVASTSAGSVKSYTSYTLASNIELGRIGGLSDGVGGIFDEVILYTSNESCADIYAAANPVDSSVGTFTLVTHRFESPYLTAAGAVDTRSSNGAEIDCVKGGSVAVHIQVQCDNVANCDPQSFPLWYSLDGVNFNQAVPDSPTADGVSLWGADSSTQLNRFTADGPLSAGLSHTDGETNLTTSSVQTYDLAQNSSLTLRYILKISPTFSGSAVWVRPQRGLGTPLDTYTTTPKINVTPMRASAGP